MCSFEITWPCFILCCLNLSSSLCHLATAKLSMKNCWLLETQWWNLKRVPNATDLFLRKLRNLSGQSNQIRETLSTIFDLRCNELRYSNVVSTISFSSLPFPFYDTQSSIIYMILIMNHVNDCDCTHLLRKMKLTSTCIGLF